MTTIAVKGLTMCSDSQSTRGEMIDNLETQKVFNVCGHLVGLAGEALSAKLFLKWFEDTLQVKEVQEEYPFLGVSLPEDLVEDNFKAVVLHPCGKIVEYWGTKTSGDVLGDYWADGSGGEYALAAMDAGATAEEAVAVGIKRDIYSGGEIQSMTLGEEPEYEWLASFTGENSYLNIDHDGYVNFGEGNYRNFSDVLSMEDYSLNFYSRMCNLMGIPNDMISTKIALVGLLDNKIKELVNKGEE